MSESKQTSGVALRWTGAGWGEVPAPADPELCGAATAYLNELSKRPRRQCTATELAEWDMLANLRISASAEEAVMGTIYDPDVKAEMRRRSTDAAEKVKRCFELDVFGSPDKRQRVALALFEEMWNPEHDIHTDAEARMIVYELLAMVGVMHGCDG